MLDAQMVDAQMISNMAAILMFENADLSDEIDCILALIAHEKRDYTALQVCAGLELARAEARKWPRMKAGKC